MNRPQHSVLVIPLLVATLALAGCPKKPASTPAASTGAASPAGAGAGASGGTAGGPSAGPAPAPSAMTGTSPRGAGTGSTAATGTVLPALPSPSEYAANAALAEIHFDFDRYDIRAQDRERLVRNAEWLKAHPGALLLVEGHADERGTNEYNLALGERRAKAVRDYLAALGVDGGRLTLISYGEERPLCTERTEACWADNRRAQFLVKP